MNVGLTHHRLPPGGNPDGENRPNGPRGLRTTCGVEVSSAPIEDGDIQLASPT